MALNTKIVNWFDSRGISPDTLTATGIYSGLRVANGDDSEVVPSDSGNVIVFPFIEGGQTVNEKYRMAGKRFAQKPNSRKTFFNADVIDDPMLTEGRAGLVITEGEMDCLSAIEAGYPFAVSVPDGAPPARDKDGNLIIVPGTTEGLDPATDEKYRYITNNLDRLGKVKRIIIATDADEPGQRLAAELVRRLGRVRCLFVTYPEGCKDLNDVLMQHGQAEVIRTISAAKPYPVSGVYKLSDFPDEAELTTYSTGWGRLDPHLRLYYPAFMVVTGKAGGGKSTWTNQLAGNMAKNYGWTVGIASFEMRVRPFVTGTLAASLLGKPRQAWTGEDRERSNAWIEDHFVFIAPDPEDDSVHDMAWLLERAETAVIRHGMRMLVIDPWNEIEHEKRRDESSTEYTGRAIKMLKRFGRQFDCLVVLVAHPTKSGAEKDPDKISLYDIAECYSADTDVLTRRGWLPFAQVTLSDDVACFDKETSSLRYEQPSRVIRQPYKGKMARFHARSLDLLVTPNHRMVVKPAWSDPIGSQRQTGIGRPTKWKKDEWSFATPGELPKAPFLIPVAPGLNEGASPPKINLDGGYDTEDFCEFVGWYLSEGCLTGVSIALAQGKEPYRTEIRELLTRMNVGFCEGITTSVEAHALATMETARFGIRKRSSPGLVEWIRKNCGGRSDTKQIPEAVFDLSQDLKRRLLMAFIKGDGHIDGRHKRREMIASAVTTSPYLRDGLQRLAIECGVSCTHGEQRQVEDHHLPMWNLYFTFGRQEIGLDLRNGHLTWEEYDGDVWCLTVPTGAFVVRRNGRPVVSGNSSHFANKADLGVVIARAGDPRFDTTTAIMAKKIRYQPEAGRIGDITVTFDKATGIFSQ